MGNSTYLYRPSYAGVIMATRQLEGLPVSMRPTLHQKLSLTNI